MEIRCSVILDYFTTCCLVFCLSQCINTCKKLNFNKLISLFVCFGQDLHISHKFRDIFREKFHVFKQLYATSVTPPATIKCEFRLFVSWIIRCNLPTLPCAYPEVSCACHQSHWDQLAAAEGVVEQQLSGQRDFSSYHWPYNAREVCSENQEISSIQASANSSYKHSPYSYSGWIPRTIKYAYVHVHVHSTCC